MLSGSSSILKLRPPSSAAVAASLATVISPSDLEELAEAADVAAAAADVVCLSFSLSDPRGRWRGEMLTHVAFDAFADAKTASGAQMI